MVEQRIENPRVGGSNPPLGTTPVVGPAIGSSMVNRCPQARSVARLSCRSGKASVTARPGTAVESREQWTARLLRLGALRGADRPCEDVHRAWPDDPSHHLRKAGDCLSKRAPCGKGRGNGSSARICSSFPVHLLGLTCMPRRVADNPNGFSGWDMVHRSARLARSRHAVDGARRFGPAGRLGGRPSELISADRPVATSTAVIKQDDDDNAPARNVAESAVERSWPALGRPPWLRHGTIAVRIVQRTRGLPRGATTGLRKPRSAQPWR